MSKILVVDDDASNREIVRLRLQKAGHEVIEAENGEQGIRKANETPFDLIILDVMMPKLDGWQVCRQLKSELRTKRIPVVMLTALNQPIEELRGFESGADDYLIKPVDPKLLFEAIEKLTLIRDVEAKHENVI